MQIILNGKPRALDLGKTVQDLLDHLALKGPLAVELNRRICPRSQHAQTTLNDGDELEIVTIVGGG